MSEQGQHRIRPRHRLVLSMHPYKLIEKNADGTGGGITLRVYGANPTPHFVDVEWGLTTEIEVLAGDSDGQEKDLAE